VCVVFGGVTPVSAFGIRNSRACTGIPSQEAFESFVNSRLHVFLMHDSQLYSRLESCLGNLCDSCRICPP